MAEQRAVAQASHQTIRLSKGKHASPSEGACVMELASMLAGEPFSDRPATVCPVIAGFMRAYNDRVDDERRQDLYRYAAEVVGTRTASEIEHARERRCLEWAEQMRRQRPRPLRWMARGGRRPGRPPARARRGGHLRGARDPPPRRPHARGCARAHRRAARDGPWPGRAARPFLRRRRRPTRPRSSVARSHCPHRRGRPLRGRHRRGGRRRTAASSRARRGAAGRAPRESPSADVTDGRCAPTSSAS